MARAKKWSAVAQDSDCAGAGELRPLDDPGLADGPEFGLKAQGLLRARSAGVAVPPGFVLTQRAARAWLAGDEPLAAAFEAALAKLMGERSDGGSRLAVRSSPSASLPGVLSTELGVRADRPDLRRAVTAVLASAEAPGTRQRLGQLCARKQASLQVGVVVQAFIEAGQEDDAGGVAFSHDVATGERALSVELAVGGGALSVVQGRGAPSSLHDYAQKHPEGAQRIRHALDVLTRSFSEPLDIELVYAGGIAWVVQLRDLVLWPKAEVALALTAIASDDPACRERLARVADRLRQGFVSDAFAPTEQPPLVRGLAASPGALHAVVETLPERAAEGRIGLPVALFRRHASAEDVPALRRAQALVTTEGGITSHAAVIARGLGLAAVVGCQNMVVDADAGRVLGRDGTELLVRGDWVSVDGQRGTVHAGRLPLRPAKLAPFLRPLFAEARKLRRCPVWVEAEVELALELREGACLDGAVCRFEPGLAFPAPKGPDHWAEVEACAAGVAAAELPPGWGLLLRGPCPKGTLEAVRRAAPLRALGLRATAEVCGSAAGCGIDLWVIDGEEAVPTGQSGPPRQVRAGVAQAGDPRVGQLLPPFEALEQALRVTPA